jgi:LmbE family N-acetylglucosaminyl deacetylase
VPELVRGAPSCALAVYAHPDDADVSCGGTLARWAGAGARVHVLICARGDKGTVTAGADPEELASRRAGELSESSRALGLEGYRILPHSDGELDNDAALRAEIVSCVRSLRPDVLVCPDPQAVFFGQQYFNHRDHRVVGWASLDAVAPAAALPLYFPDAGPPHQVREVYLSGTLEPDVWVDITATIEAKAEALMCHQSQLEGTAEWMRAVVRERAEEAGRQAGVPYAEGYRRLHLGT